MQQSIVIRRLRSRCGSSRVSHANTVGTERGPSGGSAAGAEQQRFREGEGLGARLAQLRGLDAQACAKTRLLAQHEGEEGAVCVVVLVSAMTHGREVRNARGVERRAARAIWLEELGGLVATQRLLDTLEEGLGGDYIVQRRRDEPPKLRALDAEVAVELRFTLAALSNIVGGDPNTGELAHH